MARSTSRASDAAVQLPALTAIRYFAALHVVLCHVHCSVWAELPPALNALRGHGYAAVALFYVLSGFILTHTYVRDDGSIGDRTQFWWARFARVVPLYWLALAWAAWHHVSLRGWDTPGRFAAAVAMVQAWWPDLVFGWNTPGWSISAEAFFYAVTPLLAVPLVRLRSLRAHLAAIAGLVVLGAASTWLCWQGAVGERPGQVDFWPSLAAFNPLFRLPEFMVGMVTGRIYARWGSKLRPPLALGMTLLGLGLSVAQVTLPGPELVRHGALLSPSFALLIVGLSQPTVVSRALSWRPLVRLGEASYAVYILQDPLLDTFLPLDGEPFGRPHPLPVIVRYVLVLTGVSLLLHRIFEVPLQRWLRSWLVKKA